ncbi:acyl-CoA-binding domain-containing protein 5 isoform X1 [Dendrobium catenatum]|uniref:Acyl-CoA-binding domain-containing protein 3 n=1 Tax=Dendrobium catenatum TaxID=906689 RepID=A0A2I0W6D1_9ASPA|nr:acyl-CoA-binding domain-containing protein 5 isoform X1 [Dendrobium catenatum]PKU71219.1 Acyl-CoA-binding domain-containing protein 3 [Dendrobium catenatum]
MDLDFYQELLLTAFFSVLFAFLFGKITGDGFGDGERPDDALASADLSDSREKLPVPEVEELEEAVNGFKIGKEVLGSEREITCMMGDSAERSDEVRGSGKEMRADTVEVGEEEEEINAKKMAEAMVIERDDAEDIKEEEEKGELIEAKLCSSELKMFCGGVSEIGSRRGKEVSIEFRGGSLLHGEDEWERIDKSELEKLFSMAAEYTVSSSGVEALARLSRDVQMNLYGFYKVATEGPCHESQPLPLNVSGRARWHAWQKLGSMTPETAMEQYINLLSKSIPGCIVESSGEDAKFYRADDPTGKEILNTVHHDLYSFLQNQLSPGIERKFEGHHDLASLEAESATGGSKFLEQG